MSHTTDQATGPRDAGTVLSLRDVQFAYPRTVALRGINLDVAAGEVVAVTGRSGSGKSTLLHVAAGLLRPSSGTVRILGQDVGARPDAAASSLRRKHIGLILQHGLLVPELSVLANVSLPLVLEGTHDRASADALALDWLANLEVADQAAAYPGELSGGQSQRVATARALVAGPALVLADEPTGSMDSVGGERLLDLLVSACRTGDRGLVLVTHDNRVAAAADREVRLLDGAVEYEAVLA
jgi:putative ABC transport system ATP-binding protein